MSQESLTAICQRCGRGFVLTPNHLDFISKRGIKVNVPVLCLTCFLSKGPLPKRRGKVKWFNSRKQYGFIVTREGTEVFFHQQQLLEQQKKEPQEGQIALFHIRQAHKGPEALNVELVQ